jgi:hypothetical protein
VGQNIEFVMVKPSGTYSNHLILRPHRVDIVIQTVKIGELLVI